MCIRLDEKQQPKIKKIVILLIFHNFGLVYPRSGLRSRVFFSIRNSCKISFKLFVLKLWQEWPQENEGQKKRKILQNFFVLAV